MTNLACSGAPGTGGVDARRTRTGAVLPAAESGDRALVQPIMFWVLFSAGLPSNDLGFAFFFPGTLAMILLFTAIFATISIIEDRREGFLQSVLVAPAPRWAMVLGKIVGGAVIALLQALVFLALGWLTMGLTSSLGSVLAGHRL